MPGSLEQGTTQLLNLIYQEGQYHRQGQHHGQVLLAVSVVMLQVISLVFQGVESLVLDLPAGSSPRWMFQTFSGIRRKSVIQLKCCTFPSGWISQYSSTLTNSSGFDSLSGTPLQNRK